MPEINCQTSHVWLRQIVDHAIRTGHGDIVWSNGPPWRELCIRCATCDETFTLTLRAPLGEAPSG